MTLMVVEGAPFVHGMYTLYFLPELEAIFKYGVIMKSKI